MALNIAPKLFVFSLLASVEGWSDVKQRSFPVNFMFGAGTSAYQVEGAWNIDGKGENIWDKFLHEHPEVIVDGINGDVAADSYHLYQRDVEMLRELGVDHYRFSISWSRILPSGFPNEINEKGLQYYDNLIDELLKYNIQPMITLYHMDLPQHLQDLGGWANPHSITWFEDYARVVFDRYSSKVKYWLTINQPNEICVNGYGYKYMAPALEMSGIGDYMCIKYILLAHAKAYRLYEKEYKNKHQGLVGIALSLNWADPFDNKTENVKAAEQYREFYMGMYMNPIWSKEGDFPKVVKDVIAKNSKEQGFPRSRLPTLTGDEKILLKGSADFLGMNHYTTFLIKSSSIKHSKPSFYADANVDMTQGKDWKESNSAWLRSVPYGLYKVCIHINQKYDYPKIFITEHGWSTKPGLGDQSRVDNFNEYMFALLLALEDGTDVMGYTAWSLMDNVEWTAGTSDRFGLYEVDFDSKNKTRTARLSAFVYKRLIESRVIEKDWKPKSLKMEISGRKTKSFKEEL